MKSALRNIAMLCRHEYLRQRRSMHFTRNIIIWSLKIVLWTSMALALPRTLEASGINVGESLPLLLITDQIIRWFSQSTPTLDILPYRTLPIRRNHVVAAYLLRMLLVPINLIWLPALWPQWWLVGLFILSGYIYLGCWHTFLYLTKNKDNSHYGIGIMNKGSFLSLEIKMRLRHPMLSRKIRNSLLCSLILTALCTMMNQDVYTDFTILYTLTFPTLPLLTTRLGYEQTYMSLLHTRMHGLGAIYRAKYLAALLCLLPSILILLLPITAGALSWERLIGWLMAVALLIYPTLLLCAPKGKVGSPMAQLITLATLTLPILITQIFNL